MEDGARHAKPVKLDQEALRQETLRQDALRQETLRLDPYPVYASMRAHAPVFELSEGTHFLINRYADVRAALSDSDQFTAGIETMVQPKWLEQELHRGLFILSMDPPDHTRYRRLVGRKFAGDVIRNAEHSLREHAAALSNNIQSGAEIDFSEQFAYPYIGTFINRLVGSADFIDLLELREQLAAREAVTPIEPPALEKAVLQSAIVRQNKQFSALIAARRLLPQDDLVSELLSIRIDGEPLTEWDLFGALDLFLSAGFHTSAQMLIAAVIHLAQNSDWLKLLQQNHALIPSYLEELLRLYSPTHYILRKAAQPVALHGVDIPAGAVVSLNLASANRDELHFERADEFILDRGTGHLSFGFGAHTCIGAALARLEMQTALQVLLSKFARIECPPSDQIDWKMGMTGRVARKLPVRFFARSQ